MGSVQSAEVTYGSTVTITSKHIGKLVLAENASLTCNSQNVQTSKVFVIEKSKRTDIVNAEAGTPIRYGDVICLRTVKGQYISSQNSGTVTVGKPIAGEEAFRIISATGLRETVRQEETIYLCSVRYGLYIGVEQDFSVKCSSQIPNSLETFSIQLHTELDNIEKKSTTFDDKQTSDNKIDDKQQKITPINTGTVKRQLPYGWKVLVDDNYQTYFHNESMDISQYDFPTQQSCHTASCCRFATTGKDFCDSCSITNHKSNNPQVHILDTKTHVSKDMFSFRVNNKTMRDLKIKSKLGEGGFGIVYLVQDQITGEEFALKVTNHKTEVTYLVEESYSMVRELNSPYLVGIYEMYRYNSNSDFEDDRLYILTKYCNGGDLALFLNINEEYPPADIIVEYGKCIYQGIEALHRRKMMHRNVTVDNVLVHTENGVVHVWLNDFDLVREVPDEIANMTYCGKKEYMAPEIESGEYGKQVDIFSLGMTLYILMTKNQSTMGHYKSHEERLQVIQHNMESTNMYDSSLINTVMQMLHRDPSLRCVPESWQSKYKTYNAVANPSPFEQTLVFKTKDTESRFTVIKRIGESNATVDLCLSETGEKVAVKKITVQQSRKFPNPKTVCDLIIEGVDLIREHRMSTINEVRDCYYFKERETTHAVYIVLEYIEHGELDQYIRSMTKPLPELMVVKILQQLVSALSLLHAKNIVHRDIKPENILIRTNSENTIEVVLADFDLVQQLETSRGCHTKCGTTGYMSPEVMRSSEDERYGVRSDLWSLGVVLIELMYGGKIMKDIAYELNLKERQEVVHGVIRQKLESRQVYSTELIDTALKLICYEPNDRGTAIQLFDWCMDQNPVSENVETLTKGELEMLERVYSLDAAQIWESAVLEQIFFEGREVTTTLAVATNPDDNER